VLPHSQHTADLDHTMVLLLFFLNRIPMTPPDSDHTGSSSQASRGQGHHNNGGNNKRRRNNRRRRNNNNHNDGNKGGGGGGQQRGRVRGYGRRDRDGQDDYRERKPVELTGEPFTVNGLFEIAPKGFGFLRRQDRGF